MATNNKKTNLNKSSKSKIKNNQDNFENTSANTGFRDEIILVSVIVIAILLLLSYFNLSGKIGEIINGFIFGMFGFIAYILPFFIFFATAFMISNKENRRALIKFILSIILLFLSTILLQLFSATYDTEMKIGEYYQISALNKSGGGFIGGVFCKLMCPLFGVAGTYVITIALIILIILFITGKGLFVPLNKKGSNLYKKAKEDFIEKIQYEKENTEESPAKARRRDRKANKTNTNIILQKPSKTSEEIREITDEYTISSENATVESVLDIPIQRSSSGMVMLNESDEVLNTLNIEPIIPLKEKEEPNMSYIKESIIEPADNFSDTNTVNPIDLKTDNAIQPETTKIMSKTGKVIEKDNGLLEVNSMSKQASPKANTTLSYNERINKKDTEVKEDPNDFRINQELQSKKEYVLPTTGLLSQGVPGHLGDSDHMLKATALKLQQTLESFNVKVTITNVSCGPSVTRYEIQPEQGVKVSKIVSLVDDIKLNLAAADIRIEAPIPGKSAVGIEVPNKETSAVMLREILEAEDFKKHPSNIAFAVGKDIGGQAVVTDIAKMPHLLIAGATGSGKSVCINTLIMSILYKANPKDVRLIMIDPKVVELSVYNGIPHLMIPVVTDPKKASAALNWAVAEMTDRYKKFSEYNVRDLKGCNEKLIEDGFDKLPQIVIIVDELADLMMVAPGEVEDAICRLAQMARAAGLHLIIATQRPSVNVITGLIKANVPSRIAFSVSSGVDSRTIIDMVGAEKLLGKGDMLFYPSGFQKPVRVQGAFVSDKEVSTVVEFWAAQNKDAIYSEDITAKITTAISSSDSNDSGGNERDSYFIEAGKFIIEKDKASIGMLQRVYKIGFNRAARIMDQLCEAGVVGEEEGTKPRKILMSIEEFERYVDEYV